MEAFFGTIPWKDRLMGWSIIAVPLATLVILGALFLRPEPFDQTAVHGCYRAPSAPALDVRAGVIKVGQADGATLRYRLEAGKRGWHLTVEPALAPSPNSDGSYVFAQQRGIGYFWELLGNTASDPKVLRHPADFRGMLSMYASDGTLIVYQRSSTGPCR